MLFPSEVLSPADGGLRRLEFVERVEPTEIVVDGLQ